MAYYESIFSDFVEFHYLTAPFPAINVFDEEIKQKFNGPFYAWVKNDKEKHNFEGIVES